MVRALFPGTFDPIHYGHIDIARRAERLFDEVFVAVYDRPLKNLLFSPEERLMLVKQTFVNEFKISRHRVQRADGRRLPRNWSPGDRQGTAGLLRL